MSVNLSNYSVEQLQGLIGEAQQQLERKRAEERSAVVKEIRRLAATAGLEVDLKGAGASRTRRAAGSKLPPKYRNPGNPQDTWTGRGPRPQWFKEALAKGKTPQDLAI
jgi:DNA-binding protein H-NS